MEVCTMRYRIRVPILMLIVCLVVLLAPGTQAQTATSASISGRVTDAQGAGVSGATVKLKDKATNQERSAVTSGEGLYTFPNIEPGIYDLTVSISQFKTTTIPDLKVEVTKAITQDVRLEVGQLSEQITISSTAETQLQKSDASL